MNPTRFGRPVVPRPAAEFCRQRMSFGVFEAALPGTPRRQSDAAVPTGRKPDLHPSSTAKISPAGYTAAAKIKRTKVGKGYQVQDGVLYCTKDDGGNLFTKKDYDNFVLRFEFKLERNSNNGIGIHARLTATSPIKASRFRSSTTTARRTKASSSRGSTTAPSTAASRRSRGRSSRSASGTRKRSSSMAGTSR